MIPVSSRTSKPGLKRWWLASHADAAESVFSAVKQIAAQNQQRRNDDALFMRMFGARDVVGLGQEGGSSLTTPKADLDALKFNVCRSVVLTAAAHISAKRPKPKFQTDDADWGLVQKARGCEQAVKGVFQQNDAYALGQAVFLDSAVSSLGTAKVFNEGGRVRYEKVFPGELLVDVREGFYGEPRTIYRVKLVDPQVVKELFNLKKAPTSAAGLERPLQQLFAWLKWDSTIDQTVLVEAHRLGKLDPKTGKRTGGKHIIACPGNTLVFEDWNRPRHPYAHYRWQRRQLGFYGCGIVEELRGHQRALNYLHRKIADWMHIGSRSNLVLWEGPAGKPGVNSHHVDNEPATVFRVKHGTQAPMQLTVNAVPSEYFAYRREIIEDAYAVEGVSQLTATGQVPQGIESGTAIREVEDAGSRRWATKVQDYERFFLDLARLTIDELGDMAEKGELQKIRASTRSGSLSRPELIDWKEVSLDEDQYELDLTPASSLPDSTAGRTQTVTDWYQAGFITVQEAKQLLDHPDLERFKSLDLSSYECILDTIELIVDKGEYNPPEPTDDVELGIKLATQSYNKFRLRKVPPERLELLLQYLDDLRHYAEQATQAQAPLPAAGVVPNQPAQAPMPAADGAAMPVAA